MLPLIYTHIVYTAIFVLVFSVNTIIEIFGPAGKPERRQGSENQDRGSLFFLNASAMIGAVLYFLLPFLAPATTLAWNQPLLFILGFVCVFLGAILRRYCMRTLGRFFVGSVVLQSEHKLVQEGPYRYIRHPAYSGILLGALGMGLMMGNWASLLAIVGSMFAGLLYRINVEEQALRQGIAGYDEYAHQTFRLIPFIF